MGPNLLRRGLRRDITTYSTPLKLRSDYETNTEATKGVVKAVMSTECSAGTAIFSGKLLAATTDTERLVQGSRGPGILAPVRLASP